ncbi:MAG: ABC transporter ATP-binding protein [Sandaracinaceae bacterium]|nr:ABC transporter ATP-binding protein [Sandaracinaceae bacterium]
MKRLELHDISVRFGRLAALERLDLALEAGKVLLLAGPNGAGKSTLIRVLLGLVIPTQGRLRVDDQEVRVERKLKEQIGYLPESVAFADALTGREVLGFFADARGVARPRIAAALERVGLTHAADRAVRGYSRGMRQRLGLAVSILHTPALLVLDEPTGGLDQDGLTILWSVLEEWRGAGRLVLMASHEIALLETRVDEVCLLSGGRAVARGTPHELRGRVPLPLRVRLALEPRESAAIVSRLRDDWKDAPLTLQGDDVEVVVARARLLSLLELHREHPGAIRDLRVMEPPFDEVYRSLLEGMVREGTEAPR